MYTIATLTGHAVLAMGLGLSIGKNINSSKIAALDSIFFVVLDNGRAARQSHGLKLQTIGSNMGDPFEISTIRKRDIDFHRDQGEGVDVIQCNNLPSSRTMRGHQSPAGFLLLASGLIKHGSDSEKPLAYSHLDIAASAGELPNEATGAPILALTKMFLL